VRALRHFHDVVESNVRSLKALGVAAETYGSLLASVLMNKLPGDLRLIIGRKIGEADWQLDTIMTELQQEIEAHERANPLAVSNQSNPKRGGGKPPPTAATLLLGEKPHCCYCNHSHTPEACDQVRNSEERKQTLMNSGRCFVCLRKGHLGRQCRSKLRCATCGRRHHLSICAKTSPREKDLSCFDGSIRGHSHIPSGRKRHSYPYHSCDITHLHPNRCSCTRSATTQAHDPAI